MYPFILSGPVKAVNQKGGQLFSVLLKLAGQEVWDQGEFVL
jgi:hypothetical protein